MDAIPFLSMNLSIQDDKKAPQELLQGVSFRVASPRWLPMDEHQTIQPQALHHHKVTNDYVALLATSQRWNTALLQHHTLDEFQMWRRGCLGYSLHLAFQECNETRRDSTKGWQRKPIQFAGRYSVYPSFY